VSRFYHPAEGDILFEGRSLLAVPPHGIAASGIARTFQNIELFDNATVLANLLVGRHRHRQTSIVEDILFLPKVRTAEYADRHRVEEVIDFLDLQRYRDQLIASLPYGVRKVCELARALCTEPKIILLDEPSSGLNVEETDDMVYWINDIRSELGITVLMVEHDMTLVNRVSDRVLALDYGRVVALGAPQEVARDPAVIAAYLGPEEAI
jgi:branched-chain amino acid transport system ATP-binding protein